MKNVIFFLAALTLIFSLVVTPVVASGGKNHGEVGQGTIDQGDTGADTGKAMGDDAQDNQAG